MKKKEMISIILIVALAMSTFNIMINPSQVVAADTPLFGGGGVNEISMNQSMENAMAVNADYGDAAQKAWVAQLNTRWTKEMNAFQWTDTDALTTHNICKDTNGKTWKWNDADDGMASIPAEGSETVENNPLVIPTPTGNEYAVYSGQQLKYALVMAARTSGITIRLMADLDMQGYEYSWSVAHPFVNTASHSGLTLEGNGHTIYNLGSNGNCFLNELRADRNKPSSVQNLTFVSAKLVLPATTKVAENYGLFKQTTSNNVSIKNIINNFVVRDSLFFNGGSDKYLSYTSPIGAAFATDIDDYYTINNKIYGGNNVHVGGAVGRADNSTVDSSFSVDSTVVCTYRHSGGFISCTDGNLHVTEAFTNNTVYGNKSTGVFIGATTDNIAGGTTFTRCYTSGGVEGTDSLGGFLGYVDSVYGDSATQPLTFNDCYSTSVVGMRSGGKDLGGFVGNIANTRNIITFNNCYAAGEVGSIDTDVSADRDVNSSPFRTTGGFVGNTRTGTLDAATFFKNCYYDKQTTAMREWESGVNRDAAINLIPGGGGQPGGGMGDITGIKGVLTSDSDKFGAGLAALPGSDGFTGFDKQDIIVGGNTYDLWLYDGNNQDPSLHNCEYPQLSVFASGTTTEWGDFTDVVRAFSFASAATIHQQVWDHCSNATHNSLATTTYDTVRDLTMRMTMTSYIEPVTKSDVRVQWEMDGTKTSLYGRNVPVVGYRGQTYNSVYERNYWTIDKFSPGIEWLTVKITINGVTGNRRLRIVPTANLAPGTDALNLVTGNTYNHAKDMAMAYSTGSRINDDSDDITQGVFPDLPIDAGDERKSILKNIMVGSGDSYTIDRNPGIVPSSFAADDDKFTNIKTNFMTGADGVMPDKHSNTYMNVNLYKLPEFTPDSGGGDVQIVLNESMKINLENSSNAHWRDKLNGKTPFAVEDLGRYVVEYVLVLDDARYIKDSKMLLIQPEPHTVNVFVKQADGKPNGRSLRLFMQEYDRDASVPTPSFDNPASAQLTRNDISTGGAVLFAAKKNPGDTNLISKIEFDIHTADGTRHEKIENPTIGSKFEFKMTYFYGSYENGGIYYVKQVDAVKSYILAYDKAGEYYYLKMDNKFEFDYEDGANGPQELIRNDIDNDIDVTITIEPQPQPFGTLEITKQVRQDGSETFTGDVFNFSIAGADHFASSVQLHSVINKNMVSVNLPEGSYTVKELTAMGYDLEGVTVDGVPLTDFSNISVPVKSGETVKLVVANRKTSGDGGRGNVTNELKTGG